MGLKFSNAKKPVGNRPAFCTTNITKFQEHARKALEGDRESPMLELIEGQNVIRVLPPWGPKADGNPFREVLNHQINSDAISDLTGREVPEKARFSIVCRRSELEEECPVCEYIDELMQKGKRLYLKLARMLSPTPRIYCNAVMVSYRRVREAESRRGNGAVKIWGFGGGIRKPLYSFMSGSDPEIGDEPVDFTHPQTGRNIIVTRTGQGMKTRYPEIKLGTKPLPLPSMSLLSKMQDLHAFVLESVPEYDEARESLNDSAAMMLGAGGETSIEDDLETVIDAPADEQADEDAPRPKRRLKLSR